VNLRFRSVPQGCDLNGQNGPVLPADLVQEWAVRRKSMPPPSPRVFNQEEPSEFLVVVRNRVCSEEFIGVRNLGPQFVSQVTRGFAEKYLERVAGGEVVGVVVDGERVRVDLSCKPCPGGHQTGHCDEVGPTLLVKGGLDCLHGGCAASVVNQGFIFTDQGFGVFEG
jgi:hypothetical protein